MAALYSPSPLQSDSRGAPRGHHPERQAGSLHGHERRGAIVQLGKTMRLSGLGSWGHPQHMTTLRHRQDLHPGLFLLELTTACSKSGPRECIPLLHALLTLKYPRLFGCLALSAIGAPLLSLSPLNFIFTLERK